MHTLRQIVYGIDPFFVKASKWVFFVARLYKETKKNLVEAPIGKKEDIRYT